MAKDKVINPEKMAEEIVNAMKLYTKDVEEGIEKDVNDCADDGVKMLKNTAMPPASESGTAKPMTRRQWKEYAKSWQRKIDNKTNNITATIHNKEHYQLTHLLEFGHATRDGKRTRAFAHIKPTYEKLEDQLLKQIKKTIEKGGK